MSLRDQLLKAGLVDKKRARKAQQGLRRDRRQAQGARARRQDEAAAAEARAATEQAERVAQRDAEAAHQRACHERREQKRLVGNLLAAYRLHPHGGGQRFWHRAPLDNPVIGRLDLPPATAWDLRSGRLAVCWLGPPTQPEIALIPAHIAQRVLAIDPTRVLFFNQEAPGQDPAEALYQGGPPPDLEAVMAALRRRAKLQALILSGDDRAH